MKLTLYFCFLSIQLQCCGIEGPHDWDQNVYFNCSSASVGSREACGVPFSCCKPKVDELIKNVQCGYDVRRQDYVSFLIIICKKKHTPQSKTVIYQPLISVYNRNEMSLTTMLPSKKDYCGKI